MLSIGHQHFLSPSYGRNGLIAKIFTLSQLVISSLPGEVNQCYISGHTSKPHPDAAA
jgi:hypothetical protein